jgi:UDP-N-acetylmuramoyl-L-alanyl-D-glutamate--2,6-diaminopimelate ligase
VRPGGLFVAAPGLAPPDYEPVAEAEDRGVSAVICERRPAPPPRATRVHVRDACEALARVSARFYEHPAARLRLVGVAGGRGRAGLAFLLHHLFTAAGRPAGLVGTLRHQFGERVIHAPRLAPTALELQPMFAAMLRAGAGACVLEMTPALLAARQLAGLAFDSIVCAEGADRVQLAPLAGARTRLIEAGPALPPRPYERPLLRADGSAALVPIAGRRVTLRLAAAGRTPLRLAVAALHAGLACGLDLGDMLAALAELPAVPGQLERLPGRRPFDVFVDAAADADALRGALADLREITPGRLIVMFGATAAAGLAAAREAGRVAARIADHVIVTTDNPRRQDPARLAAAVVAGLEDFAPPTYALVPDRRRAIAAALRAAQPGDLVLLAGKGHATYQEFDDAVVPFDDRHYALETLAELDHAA